MSDWQLDQRRRRGEHVDEFSVPAAKAKEVKKGLKSFFIGDTPSEMAFNAATLGFLPAVGMGKAAKLGLGGLSALLAADDVEAGALGQLRRMIIGSKDLDELRRALAHITSRRPSIDDDNEWRKVIMANELVANAETPGVRTHMFVDDTGKAQGAYQLSGAKDGTYLPYMVADQKGLGTELLDDAQFLTPTQLLELYAIPGSDGFYRKRPGWREDQTDGISRFRYQKPGGLTQMRKP